MRFPEAKEADLKSPQVEGNCESHKFQAYSNSFI